MSKSNLEFILRAIEILGNDSPDIERRLKRLEDAVFGLHNVVERPYVKPVTVGYHNRNNYGGNARDIVLACLTDKPRSCGSIAKETGIRLRTVQARCSELTSEGKAERTGRSTYRRKA